MSNYSVAIGKRLQERASQVARNSDDREHDTASLPPFAGKSLALCSDLGFVKRTRAATR